MQPLGALLGCGGGQGDLSGPGAWTLAWPLLRPPLAWLPLCIPRSPLSRAGPETAPLPTKSAAVLPADLAQPASARGASSYPPAWPVTCRHLQASHNVSVPHKLFMCPPQLPGLCSGPRRRQVPDGQLRGCLWTQGPGHRARGSGPQGATAVQGPVRSALPAARHRSPTTAPGRSDDRDLRFNRRQH